MPGDQSVKAGLNPKGQKKEEHERREEEQFAAAKRSLRAQLELNSLQPSPALATSTSLTEQLKQVRDAEAAIEKEKDEKKRDRKLEAGLAVTVAYMAANMPGVSPTQLKQELKLEADYRDKETIEMDYQDRFSGKTADVWSAPQNNPNPVPTNERDRAIMQAQQKNRPAMVVNSANNIMRATMLPGANLMMQIRQSNGTSVSYIGNAAPTLQLGANMIQNARAKKLEEEQKKSTVTQKPSLSQQASALEKGLTHSPNPLNIELTPKGTK